MARRPYPTDLSDAEWELIDPHIPAVKSGGRQQSIPAGNWWTPCPTCCAVAVPGACCHMTFHPGKRSITTSAAGARPVSSKRSTMLCVSRFASMLAGTEWGDH